MKIDADENKQAKQSSGAFLSFKNKGLVCVLIGILLGAGGFFLYQKLNPRKIDFSNEGAPQDQFLKIYFLMQEAEKLENAHLKKEALAEYKKCLARLEDLQKQHPNWEPVIVRFRLKYFREKVNSL